MTRPWPDIIRGMAAAALALVIIAGSAFLWIGIPILGFWLAGELTASSQNYLFFALPGIPLAMVAFGWLLYRVNAVYERVHGDEVEAPRSRSRWLGSLSDERETARRERAPRPLIDIAMTVSAIAALALMVVWFFFFANAPLGPMQ